MADPAQNDINPRREAFRANMITAAELGAREFEPIKWAVPRLLPEGTTVLAGPPKIGKSWLVLNIALAVAKGGKALGSIDVEEAGDVLYLALEDNERRLQRRLKTMQPDGALPDRLTLTTMAPRLDDGLLPEIERWMDQAESPRLVILDTMQRIRPSASGKLSRYEEDYSVGEALQRLTRAGLAVVVVHHTRKMESDDPLEEVSGTLGLTGGMDGCMVLKRSRAQYDAELFVTGRDIDETTYALKFAPKDGAWTLLGDAARVPGGAEQAAIVEVLKKGPLKPKEIAAAVNKHPGTVRVLLGRMTKRGSVTKRLDGKYELATLDGDGDDTQPFTPHTPHTPFTPFTPFTEGVNGEGKRGYTTTPVNGVNGVNETPPSQQPRGFPAFTPGAAGVNDLPAGVNDLPAGAGRGRKTFTPGAAGVNAPPPSGNAYQKARDGS